MKDLLGLDPTVFSHETIQSNGVQLHYVLGGHGPVVLLWHGFLETWFCWRKIMPELAEKYTVIAPDMRGYGDSEKPEHGYDTGTLAQDFRTLVQDLGIKEKIIIIAHDMGAAPALIYAGEYPDEVKAVVYLEEPVLTMKNMQLLHSFTPDGTKKGGLWWWSFAFATDMPELLIVGKERDFLTWFYHDKTHDHGASIEETAVEEYLRTFNGVAAIRGSFGVYREIFSSIKQTEKYEGMFNKISVPVLALGGDLSLGKTVKTMLEGVAKHVHGGTVPDCGHFIQDEQPEYLLKQIAKFLGGIT